MVYKAINNKVKKILIVDDDKLIQILYKNILSSDNHYLIVFANNGLEAIKKFTKDFVAIFMDVNMPLMDGIEATKKIRHSLSKNIPIIGVTANLDIKTKNKCLKAGMNKILEKPIWKDALIATLNSYAN